MNNAAACQTTVEEAAHVAAFAASSYESTAIRVNKPFNPMLGETFECDRRAEYGWRVLFEQVRDIPIYLLILSIYLSIVHNEAIHQRNFWYYILATAQYFPLMFDTALLCGNLSMCSIPKKIPSDVWLHYKIIIL